MGVLRRGNVSPAAWCRRQPLHIRQEDVWCLVNWFEPASLDRVPGTWRPLESRDADVAAPAAESIAYPLLRSGPDELKAEAVRLVAAYRVRSDGNDLSDLLRSASGPLNARVGALRAMDAVDDAGLSDAIVGALKDSTRELRLAAREILARRNPQEAVRVLGDALMSGEARERQAAIAALAGMQTEAADAELFKWLGRLTASPDKVPVAIRLELLEAAERRGTD